uniref:Uncharacterized protein n=2 Tax=Bursaphelenchus xylophilus TaxID=6326 RepID=A0A1I7S8B0_BURXY
MVVQLILPVLLIFHFVFSREHCPDLKRGDFTEYFEVYGKDLGDRRYEIHGFFTELDKPLKNGYKITVSEGDPINPGHFDFSILLSGLADKKNDVVILDPLRKLDGENLFEFPPNSVNFIRQNYAFTFGDLLILNQTHFADIPEIDENRLDGKALYRFEPLANLRKFNYSEDAIEGIRKCFDRKKLEYCTFNGTHVIEGERQFLGINEGWAISMAPYERRFTLYQINNTE